MRYLKREHQQLNTDIHQNADGTEAENIFTLRKGFLGKKEAGKLEWMLGLFFLQFMMVFMAAGFQIISYKTTSDTMEDALAASGLASALIDIERYGAVRELVISDSEGAYSIYRNALAENLGIDGGVIGSTDEARVKIEKYILYNVLQDTVQVVEVDDRGVISETVDSLGSVTAPNGEIIRATGVYSEISFYVDGIFGIRTKADKGKLIEINRQETEEQNEGL